tara:strand:- start:1386 stop:1559 length:174 start_codon:yes stop_codon:yes gene_type:complete
MKIVVGLSKIIYHPFSKEFLLNFLLTLTNIELESFLSLNSVLELKSFDKKEIGVSKK